MTDLQQDAPSAPPAGWYPDPVRPGSTRYWSGTGWTDQVATPELLSAGVQAVAEPVFEPPPITFAATPPRPPERHATQSEWHRASARPLQRAGVAPVSSTMRTASAVSASSSRPYDRNWIAGVAIVVAIASIPAIGVRVLMDLPPLTQSILAGAPIGIALLAFARAARGGSGLVLSIVAVVLAAVTLVAGWVVDPALIRSLTDGLLGLLPA